MTPSIQEQIDAKRESIARYESRIREDRNYINFLIDVVRRQFQAEHGFNEWDDTWETLCAVQHPGSSRHSTD